MASSSKKKTTMAKIQRENSVRERRMRKAARKAARKEAAAEPVEVVEVDELGEPVVAPPATPAD